MFDFMNATQAQRAAITAPCTPLLVTGGPGTGKTWTLVRRAAYLIQDQQIDPSQILVLTRTEGSACALQHAAGAAFAERGLLAELDRTRILTFAQYSEQLLAAGCKAEAHVLSPEMQQYVIYLYYPLLRRAVIGLKQLEDEVPDRALEGQEPRWAYAGAVRDFLNRMTEAQVDMASLRESKDPEARFVCALSDYYASMLRTNGLTDCPRTEAAALALLRTSEASAEKGLHVLVDNLEDATYLQMLLVSHITRSGGSLVAAGNEDEAILRGLGGRTGSILDFESFFPGFSTQIVMLDVNFRSNEDIITFGDQWMAGAETDQDAEFRWGRSHRRKVMQGTGRSLRSPGAVRMEGEGHSFQKHFLSFMQQFREGDARDLSQAAFLSESVRTDAVRDLIEYLRENLLPIWAPETDCFFRQTEVMQLIGSLLAGTGLTPDETGWAELPRDVAEYYSTCLATVRHADDYADAPEAQGTLEPDEVIRQFLRQEPFDAWISEGSMPPTAAAQSVSVLLNALDSFLSLPPLHILANTPHAMLTSFLPAIFRNGIWASCAYTPRGHLGMYRITTARNVQFPAVFVNVQSEEESQREALADRIEREYAPGPETEPADTIAAMDERRLYYVAFSRAEDLLVVASETPQAKCRFIQTSAVRALPAETVQQFSLSEFHFRTAEPAGFPVPAWLSGAKKEEHADEPAERADNASSSGTREEQRKGASPSSETRRYLRSLSVSAAGHHDVDDETADDQGRNHQPNDE